MPAYASCHNLRRSRMIMPKVHAGSRLDNLVQIGHNVLLGRCCVIVAQFGISGSTVLEDFVRVRGQAAMAGHLRIGEGAEVGAQAGVISDIAPGATVLGSPAQPMKDFFRQIATLKRWQSEDSAALCCNMEYPLATSDDGTFASRLTHRCPQLRSPLRQSPSQWRGCRINSFQLGGFLSPSSKSCSNAG
jgi:hypothetical protein